MPDACKMLNLDVQPMCIWYLTVFLTSVHNFQKSNAILNILLLAILLWMLKLGKTIEA